MEKSRKNGLRLNEKQKSIIFLKVTWFAVTHQFLFGFSIGLDEVLPSFRVPDVFFWVIKIEALNLVVLVKMVSFAKS